jgi:hypothetical protein
VSRRAQSAIKIWIDYDYRDQITNATYRVDYYQLFCCCTPSYHDNHDNLAFVLTSARVVTEISVDTIITCPSPTKSLVWFLGENSSGLRFVVYLGV